MTQLAPQFLSATSLAPVLWNLTALSRVILFVYVGFLFFVFLFFRLPEESYRYLCQGTINPVVKINSELGNKCSYSLTLFWLRMKQNLMPSSCGLEACFKALLLHRENGARICRGARPCHFSVLSLRCLGHKLVSH